MAKIVRFVVVDVSQLPGYQPVPENCPQWKKAMIEKKNAQLLEDAKVCEVYSLTSKYTYSANSLRLGYNQHMSIQPLIVHQVPITARWTKTVWIQSLAKSFSS